MTLSEKKNWINKAINNGACEDFKKYVSRLSDEKLRKKSVYSLPDSWLLWAVGVIGLPCTNEQFEMWGNKEPRAALQFCSSRLSDEQLERWGNLYPDYALHYCLSRLSEEQLERWGNKCPWIALIFCSDRLTDEQKERFEKM